MTAPAPSAAAAFVIPIVLTLAIDIQQASQNLPATTLLRDAQVSGRVIDDEDHAVPGAIVLLRGGPPVAVRTFVTREDGSFSFDGVPAGSFTFGVMKKGYPLEGFPGNDGSSAGLVRVAVALRQHVAGVVLRLPRGGAISGRVQDASGIAGERPQVSVTPADGHSAVRPADERSTLVDSAGRFRLYGLRAGRYAVKARMPGKREHEQEVHSTFAVVAPGEERSGVDLQAPKEPERAASLNVDVSYADGRKANAEVHVLFADTGIPAAEPSRTSQDSVATVSSLPPGRYRVIARHRRPTIVGDLWGAARVTLDGAAAASLAITLRESGSVHGRLTFAGAPLDPAEQRASPPRVVADPGTSYGSMLNEQKAFVDADGTFSILNVPAGRYSLDIWREDLPEWHLESAMLGDVDVLDFPFDVDANTVAGIVATATNSETRIEGTMRRGTSPAAHVDVVAFAVDPKHHRPASRRIQAARTNGLGRFVVRGLPPGEYAIAELPAGSRDPIVDPSALAALRVATTVALTRGERKVVDVRAGPEDPADKRPER